MIIPPLPEQYGLQDQMAQPGTMLAQAPPQSQQAVPIPGTAPTGGWAPDPEFQDFMNWTTKQDVLKEAAKHREDKNYDDYMKKYNVIQDAGGRANASLPLLKTAQKLVEDKRMEQGWGAGILLDIDRLKVLFGGDPNAAAVTETFNKIMSSQILDDMKIMLQGLGQVRIAEISLLGKATASMYNTQPANRAVIALMLRTHQQADIMARYTNLYDQGWRWDSKGKPYKTDLPPTNGGLDQLKRQILDRFPALTSAQIEEYENLFKKDSGYDKVFSEKLGDWYKKINRGEDAGPKPTRGGSNTTAPPPNLVPSAPPPR